MTSPQAIAALKLTLIAAVIVVAVNVVTGTAIAWVLVRDSFRGKSIVNSVIDLPFAPSDRRRWDHPAGALRTKQPGGDRRRLHPSRLVMALLFVTLPFIVRAVQPVLLELDQDMEEAAASLGAGPLTTFRRIIFPNLRPALLAGMALAFARAIGEFGSLVLISGNLPFKTQTDPLLILGLIESGATTARPRCRSSLLVIALAVLLVIGRLTHWSLRHAARGNLGRWGLRTFALGYLAVLLLIPFGTIFYRAFEHGLAPH